MKKISPILRHLDPDEMPSVEATRGLRGEDLREDIQIYNL